MISGSPNSYGGIGDRGVKLHQRRDSVGVLSSWQARIDVCKRSNVCVESIRVPALNKSKKHVNYDKLTWDFQQARWYLKPVVSVPPGEEKQALTIVVMSAEGCKVLVD